MGARMMYCSVHINYNVTACTRPLSPRTFFSLSVTTVKQLAAWGHNESSECWDQRKKQQFFLLFQHCLVHLAHSTYSHHQYLPLTLLLVAALQASFVTGRRPNQLDQLKRRRREAAGTPRLPLPACCLKVCSALCVCVYVCVCVCVCLPQGLLRTHAGPSWAARE